MLCHFDPEERVPQQHPLRRVKALADEALRAISDDLDKLYKAGRGRPSIPPERVLKAMLLIALYSVRSERLFCEQLQYDFLFRWFLGMDSIEPAFNASSLSYFRGRMAKVDVAGRFFQAVLDRARREELLSDEHFTVDGTLFEAWASIKSFRPKDEKPEDDPRRQDPANGWVDFKGEKRSNETHESKTDPEAMLARKSPGQTAKLSYAAHGLMENRTALLLAVCVTRATGTAEREAAIKMLSDLPAKGERTLGADKGYDTRDFVAACKELGIKPHVARKRVASAVAEEIANSPEYAVSQRKRKLIEEIWGWLKGVGNFRRTRLRGLVKNNLFATIAGAAYNLIRLAGILKT